MPPDHDPFDPEVNRLPSHAVGTIRQTKRLPRHKRGDQFLWAPLPLSWIGVAGKLPGRALQVGLVLWWLGGIRKTRTVKWEPSPARKLFGLDYYAAHRGLKALEAADLVTLDRHRGRCPIVTILDGPPPMTET